jgi:hypothetical protein
MLELDRYWRRSDTLRVGKSSHGCDGQDSGLKWYELQGSIVSAETPIVVLLGHDVKCGGPRIHGAAGCAISQHDVEFRFGNSQPVRC